MIRLGTGKAPTRLTDRSAVEVAPSQEAAHAVKGKVKRPFSPVRLIGNLLIVSGLLMMLGIGGWYGYSQWDNQQTLSRIAAEFPTSTTAPVVAAAPKATAIALAPAVSDLNLNSAQSQAAKGGWLGLASKLPQAIDNSPPLTLTIPSVNISSKIVPISWKMIPSKGGGAKSEWQVADYAVGHHQGSANPGQPGNVVLSGHVDYKGQVFKDLHLVRKGDEVTVYTEKGQYMYVVTNMVIVQEDGASAAQKASNAAYMNPTPDQTLTMITCFPYGIDDKRLIVIAKPYQPSASLQSEFVIR